MSPSRKRIEEMGCLRGSSMGSSILKVYIASHAVYIPSMFNESWNMVWNIKK